jgi:Ser/Thr protein kinase RdoA (MazF antagonist)
MIARAEVIAVAQRFALDGPVSEVSAIEVGLINATYQVSCGERRYVIQRLNREVFGDPEAVMRNVERVTEHLAGKVGRHGGRALRLVAAADGGGWVWSGKDLWRCYDFVTGCRTVDTVESVSQAREAGQAFGEFLRMLEDLPAAGLVETIPGFHATGARYARLEEVALADGCGRVGEVAAELEKIRRRERLARRFEELEERGELRRRVVHNDTKISNVMFDEVSGRAVCVIDLDTVMPGLVVHDFGDLVRSAANPAAEDERALGKIVPRMDVFGGLAEGFLAGTAGMLSATERAELAIAPQVLALELAMRFLTDFLEGDKYFHTERGGQNLDRCRVQLALLEGFENAAEEMARVLAVCRN